MRQLILTLIAGYSRLISPLTGRSCRFYPTCSDYARQAVNQFGVIQGIWMAVCRIGKCHPWHPGGFDPVEKVSHPDTKDSDTCCHGQTNR